MNFDMLCTIKISEEKTNQWLSDSHLIRNSAYCRKCGGRMTLYVSVNKFRCTKNYCNTSIGLRIGSFFEKQKLPLRNILRIMFCWASGLPNVTTMQTIKVTMKTVVDWYSFCRDICISEIERK